MKRTMLTLVIVSFAIASLPAQTVLVREDVPTPAVVNDLDPFTTAKPMKGRASPGSAISRLAIQGQKLLAPPRNR
jgi:hypothetical protein